MSYELVYQGGWGKKPTFIEDINDTVMQGLFLQPSQGTESHWSVMWCTAEVLRSKTDEEHPPTLVMLSFISL